MKKIILSLVVLLYINSIQAQLNGTYSIGASQPFPFNTLINAVTNLNTVGVSGPVTFLLTDALYEESGIEFITVAGTSTTNIITLRPENGVDAEIRGSGEFVFGIDRTSHLTFNGLSPNGTGSLTITSIETLVGSSVIKATTQTNVFGNMLNIHITNCNINAALPFFSEDPMPKSYGIEFNSNSGSIDTLVFRNNIFTGGDKSIFTITNGNFEKIEVINNKFILAGGIELGDFGIVDGKSIKIQGNVFTNTNLGYSLGALSVIYIWGGIELIFTNNVFNGINYNFTSFNDDCILFYFTVVKNTFIFNNIFKNINYNATFSPVPNFNLGTFVSIFTFSGNENLKFYHNSVYIPVGNENGLLSGDALFTGIRLHSNQNLEFKNNIFALLQGNKPGETVNSIARVYELSDETDLIGLQSDNNTYIVANHTNNYFYSILSPEQNGDFSQWQTNYPSLDQNSYWEMPNIISPDDLHLSQDCNRGTPIAEVALDFEGTIRSAISPDIGAYEYIKFTNIDYIGTCQLTQTEFSIISTGQVQSSLWNFGDSQTSTELTPLHTYTNAGTYMVTLTVTYTDNTTDTVSKQITIYQIPAPLTILHD